MTSFTAHNVILDDGSQTAPELGWSMDQSPHVTLMRRMSGILFPSGTTGRTVVDLGCLEGGFATEFARLGFDSTGIEVRQSNFANCLHVRKRVDLANLRFAKDDAWNLDAYGPFDVVFCCGLYYHIDRVSDFMALLSRNCRSMMIMDTHFAPEDDASKSIEIHHLSPLTTHEGLPGRWLPEHDLEVADQALDTLKWASWKNKVSFWPTRAALLDLMKSSGFDTVFESFEQLAPDIVGMMSAEGFYTTHTRSVFVGLKTG